MLVIDDNLLRLSKMQEALLRNSNENREENLRKYKQMVIEIDACAFADILEQIEHIDEHNHTLEEELKFLETIKECYTQLDELQSRFKNVCELYGNTTLVLSDLSKLNIDYIDSRISAISGYLINLKNIEDNKQRLEELSKQLVSEEKKKDYLSKKLLELECMLRDSLADSEGRFFEDGKLKYVSVLSEYQEIGFDFRRLLTDVSVLDGLLGQVSDEYNSASDKLRTAEICYNSVPSVDSKQILDEIGRDFAKVAYKLSLLKILKLLSENFDDYNLFKEKREKILSLFEYRLSYLKKLGVSVSFDPFDNKKVQKQLDMLTNGMLVDNSKVVSGLIKEISQLNSRTEEMIKQNDEYLILLSDTRNLIESSIGFNDVDISSVEVSDDSVREVLVTDNLVVRVRSVSDKMNIGIVKQKTSGVIKRVNQMINSSVVTDKRASSFVPELVVVPKKVEVQEEKIDNDVIQLTPVGETVLEVDDNIVNTSLTSNNKKDLIFDDSVTDIFETVVPFSEPMMFLDRTDNVVVSDKKDKDVEQPKELDELPELELHVDEDVSMPDVFWPSDNAGSNLEEDDDQMSFEDGLRLLGIENDSSSLESSEVKRLERVIKKAA